MRGHNYKKFVGFVTCIVILLAFIAISLRLEAKILKHKGLKRLVFKDSLGMENQEIKGLSLRREVPGVEHQYKAK